MSSRPGTVSKILWHFTGGPLWDNQNNKQLKELKPTKKGYDALNSILYTHQIKVGNYAEIVKVIIPSKRIFDPKTEQHILKENYPLTIKSAPVCCIADIPLQHIAYHSNRYGKIAIGFRRDSVLKAGFNPVMYTLENSDLINSIYKGYDAISDIEANIWSLENECENLQSNLDGLDENIDTSSLYDEITYLEDSNESAIIGYSNILAFIKTFDEDEFDTIYCEREWRSLENFKFTVDDIAIIILPRNQDGFNFYDDFINNTDLPRSITIAAWEDLIEH